MVDDGINIDDEERRKREERVKRFGVVEPMKPIKPIKQEINPRYQDGKRGRGRGRRNYDSDSKSDADSDNSSFKSEKVEDVKPKKEKDGNLFILKFRV